MTSSPNSCNQISPCGSPVNFLPPRVVGICGHKGHGKNLLASFIQVVDPAFRCLAFADPLKVAVAGIFCLDLDELHDPERKEVPFLAPIEMDQYLLSMQQRLGIEIQPGGEIANSPRELMQKFGTEYVRDASPGYWVRSVMREIRRSGRDTLITDVRFPDEADAVRRSGGLVVRLVRDHQFPEAEHVSEKNDFWPDALFHVASGDHNRLRDVAFAIVAMANGPRVFPTVYGGTR